MIRGEEEKLKVTIDKTRAKNAPPGSKKETEINIRIEKKLIYTTLRSINTVLTYVGQCCYLYGHLCACGCSLRRLKLQCGNWGFKGNLSVPRIAK